MNYTEADLTEATKIIDHIRSLQKYAIALSFLGTAYFLYRFYGNSEIREIFLLSLFTGVIIIGSLSFIMRPNHKTAIIYSVSCVVSAGMFLFSLYYYQNRTPAFLTTAGSIVGILLIRQGVMLVFGKQSQYIFSRNIQKRISFVNTLIKSLKQSHPDDENIIHCTYDADGKTRNMRIQFFEAAACFLLNGQPLPVFFDHGNLVIFELQNNAGLLHVSVVGDNHDWLEADLKPDDFRKYEKWKDRQKR